MKSQHIYPGGAADIRVIVLDDGEEAFSALQAFARETGVSAASLTAIGAFSRATVGWFDFGAKAYKKIEVDEQCEVLSAIGDIAMGDDGGASLHVHVVLGLSDACCWHLPDRRNPWLARLAPGVGSAAHRCSSSLVRTPISIPNSRCSPPNPTPSTAF